MALTLKKIEKLKRGQGQGRGRHFDKDGLYLEMSGTGNGSWLLRYSLAGKEHWLGLGPLRNFDLDEARERAKRARQKLSDGLDPLAAKREETIKQRLEAAKQVTFAKATQSYYDAYQSKWSAVHRAQFLNTLEQHAFPVLGELSVASIDTGLVLAVLEPIWIDRHVTAGRLRGRIEKVLDWCTVRGYRQGDNPARWRGHLKEALPSKIVKVIHHAALAHDGVPTFVQQLLKHQGIAPRALEFLILTAARTGEVLGARWKEFDFKEDMIWTVPADRMKGRRPHRVPLTKRMIELLKSLPREGGQDGLVFIGSKVNAPLDKMALPDLLKAMGYGHVTIHGFRSSFRTWAAESTAFAREVIEAALAHVVGDKSEQAYQRSDVVEKRRMLMEAWSAFIASPSRAKTGTNNVTPMRKGGV